MTTSKNIALLIDADNASPSGLDPALTVLAELGSVNIKRAYGNWSKAGLKELGRAYSALRDRAAAAVRHHQGQERDRHEDRDRRDGPALFRDRSTASGSCRATAISCRSRCGCRQSGLPVYGFGTERAPEGFREACTRFFDLGALEQAQEPTATSPMPD
jgi:hypothetical protein